MKKAIFFTIGWLYLLTIQTILNICGNLYWLIIIPFKYSKEYRKSRKSEYKRIKKMTTEEYLEFLPRTGIYMYDGLSDKGIFRMWPTWTALPYITVMRGLKGNCQDFAALNKKILGKYAKVKISVPLSIKKLHMIHYIILCTGPICCEFGEYVITNSVPLTSFNLNLYGKYREGITDTECIWLR